MYNNITIDDFNHSAYFVLVIIIKIFCYNFCWINSKIITKPSRNTKKNDNFLFNSICTIFVWLSLIWFNSIYKRKGVGWVKKCGVEVMAIS